MSHAAQLIADALTLEDGELFHTKKGKARPCPPPLAPLADTHGHLTVLRSHDPALAVARAAIAGVRLLVVPIDPVGDCGLDPTDDMPSRTPAELIAFLDEAHPGSPASFSASLPRRALCRPSSPGGSCWAAPRLTCRLTCALLRASIRTARLRSTRRARRACASCLAPSAAWAWAR